MIEDGRGIPAGTALEADVCIVGAGAAGITLALALEHAHLRIALLESGGEQPSPEAQDFARGRSIGLPYFPLESARLRCLGGSTMHWGGFCRPFEPIDFEKRPWVPHSGWPITRRDLDPYYERAQGQCQLGAFAYLPEDWDLTGAPVLPLWGRQVVTKLIQFSPPTRFGVRFRDPLVRSRATTVYLNSTVVRLEAARDGGLLTGLEVATTAGNHFSIKARAYVLAAGGIDNPRLLLASNDTRPAGIGNDYDLVGRFFADHIQFDAAGVFPLDERRSFDLYLPRSADVTRRPKDPAGSSARIMGNFCLDEEAQQALGTLNYSAKLVETTWQDYFLRADVADTESRSLWRAAGATLGNLWDNLGDAFETASRQVRGGEHGRFYVLVTHPEQAPNPASRVLLSTERDALGMPRPILDWRLTELDLHSIEAAFEALVRAFGGSHLARLHAPFNPRAHGWPPSMTGGWHHCGTTRMHADPRQGVVNADGRVHGIGNLYITGSSVFTTNSVANPTLTIVALAFRLADHLSGVLG